MNRHINHLFKSTGYTVKDIQLSSEFVSNINHEDILKICEVRNHLTIESYCLEGRSFNLRENQVGSLEE
jgi:hypothetical protein